MRLPARVRQSFLLKFAVSLFLMVAIIALVGFFAQARAVSTLEQDVQQQLIQETNTEAQRLSEWFESNELPARTISDHPSLEETANTTAYLEAQLTEQKVPDRVIAIHIIDTYGRIVTSTDKERGERVTDKPYGSLPAFQELGAVKTTRPFTNDEGKTVIAVMSPVEQEPTHTLVLEVSTAELTAQFDSGIEGTFTEVVRPVSGDTEVLFSNRRETVGTQLSYVAAETIPPENKSVSQAAIPEVSEANLHGNFSNNPTRDPQLDGEYVVAYTRIEDKDWVVITHAPADNAYQLREDIRRGFTLFLILAVLGVIIIGGTLGRNTTRQIQTLSEKANEVKQRNYDIELRSDCEDEIGELYDSIHEMRDTLRRHIRTLEHRNEQLQVMDRLLRHNLKNDMNVIQIRAEMTQREADGQPEQYAAEIVEQSEIILEQADKQRDVTKMLSVSSDQMQVDVVSRLEETIASLENEFPDAQITLGGPETASAQASSYLGIAFTELVENAIIHNDQEQPTVDITVRQHDSTLEVEIADDGPGIPAVDRRIILGEQEIDPLDHGSGIGLWLVYWIVDQSGGSIQYQERSPRGAIVTLVLQTP